VADGQNEKGLVIGMLYLPGYSQYLDPAAAPADKSLGSWEVPNYLLANCATVDEAVAALKNDIYVAQQEFVPFKEVLPVHWWIGDASGKVVIAEYVDGELKIHDAPLGVLTNSPPYDWQTINVGNYVDLSPVNVPERTLGAFTSANYGQGSGAIGLPGDFTPPSRFIRAALFSHWATPGATANETVNLGFHVLNTFDIFNGAIQSNTADQTANTKGFLTSSGQPKLVNTDTTEWTVAHDRTNLKTYVRTYNGLKIQMVDLKAIDFGQAGARVIDLQNDFAPEDITAQAKPLAVKSK
jgi:choloylglycine hydrolase